MPPRITRNSRAHSSLIPIHTHTLGTRTLVAFNYHLSPCLIPLPVHHLKEDFTKIPRTHQTELTLDRENNPDDPGDDGPGDDP